MCTLYIYYSYIGDGRLIRPLYNIVYPSNTCEVAGTPDTGL